MSNTIEKVFETIDKKSLKEKVEILSSFIEGYQPEFTKEITEYFEGIFNNVSVNKISFNTEHIEDLISNHKLIEDVYILIHSTILVNNKLCSFEFNIPLSDEMSIQDGNISFECSDEVIDSFELSDEFAESILDLVEP